MFWRKIDPDESRRVRELLQRWFKAPTVAYNERLPQPTQRWQSTGQSQTSLKPPVQMRSL